MALPPIPPLPDVSVVEFPNGSMDPTWRSFWLNLINFFQSVGTFITALQLANLRSFANDAAAAAATPPVPVGGFYRNGSIIMIRAI